MKEAPGWPGIPPRWTSSDKDGIGTALTALSRVWFTISHGILNEVYYPRVDQVCIRDLGLIVTDGAGFFSEEKRDALHFVSRPEDGVPAHELDNCCVSGRYRITKRIISDPARDVVLQSIRLENFSAGPLKLFVLLAPHLVNGGANNTAWVGDYKGVNMLFAEGDGTSLALAASVPWKARSAGFVGFSDGWGQIGRDFALLECHERATDGNVALTGELDWEAAQGGEVVLALAFGRTWTEAALRARLSLTEGFASVSAAYHAEWREFQQPLLPFDRITPAGHNSYRISTSVLRVHELPSFPGGFIASLSIPWGSSKGDDDLGGYHLVWPRDLVQTAGGLIACGAGGEALRILDYLRAIQEPDGSWPQNAWLDGVPYWRGVQLDECAFPILLVDLSLRAGLLTPEAVAGFWPMVRTAAHFVQRNGPITGQDRWEEDFGLSSFTLAVTISALLVAADLGDMHGDPAGAALMRDTADSWNASIEDWTYAAGTPLAAKVGAAGYYVRIAPPEGTSGPVIIKNRRVEASVRRSDEVVSPDALALVRFGLRAADDPRILDTIRVVDASLCIDLPQGKCWYRYDGDGYGEHQDGSAFDGIGIGRPWPLLTGERAHYELAAGNRDEALRLLVTMEAFAGLGGLLPEQVWDADDIPERELFRGHPSGSAMPLVWAHAEHIKLLRSLADGEIFDLPRRSTQRYLRDKVVPRVAIWRPDLPTGKLPAGRTLRIDLPEPSRIRYTTDNWTLATDIETVDTGIGAVHVAEIQTSGLGPAGQIKFTWQSLAGGAWAGKDYVVDIVTG